MNTEEKEDKRPSKPLNHRQKAAIQAKKEKKNAKIAWDIMQDSMPRKRK